MATVTKLATGAAVASGVYTNGSWSNEGNARDGTAAAPDNNTYATCTTAGRNKESASLWPFVFNTSDIPTGSTINSLTVALQWKGSTSSSNYTIRSATFDGSADATATALSANPAASASPPPTSDTNVSYTLSTVPSLSQLQAGIWVRVSALQGGTSTSFTASLDYITVTVNYTAPNSAPNAPTLSLPSDTGTVSTTTPELDFSATDPDSNNISYEVQVDTVNTFDSHVIDSYSGTNFVTWQQVYASIPAVGQSFTGDGTPVGGVSFTMTKLGAPTGSMVAKIYAHAGTYGTSSIPTGSALVVSTTIDVSSLPASPSTSTISFSFPQFTPAIGTHYIVTVEYSGGDATNQVNVRGDGSGTALGNQCSLNTGTWRASSTTDLDFEVFGAIVDKVSSSDSGFTDTTNGADTDPFASGDSISYITPALTNGTTYYWRVRGIDPTGSNTYGSWSSTRSFTVSTGGGSPTPTNQFFAMM